MAYDYSGLGARYKKRYGADSAIGGMARQGFSGKGFTGSPENIAQLTGKDYTNPNTGLVTPNVGGPTWQQLDQNQGGLTGTQTTAATAPTGGLQRQQPLYDTEDAGVSYRGEPAVSPQQAEQPVDPGDIPGPGGYTPNQLAAHWEANPGSFEAMAQQQQQPEPEGGLQGGKPGTTGAGGFTTTLGGTTVQEIAVAQLGREFSPEELAYYEGEIAAGRMTMEQLASDFQGTPEGQEYQTTNEKWLSNRYKIMTGKDIDPEAMNNLSRMLREGASGAEINAYIQGGIPEPVITDAQQAVMDKTDYETKQTDATENANQVLEDSIDEYSGPLDPYSDAGIRAQKMIDDLDGLNGEEARAAAIEIAVNNPAVEAHLEQMREQQIRGGAATGQLRGGNMQTALVREVARIQNQAIGEYRTGLETTAAGGLTAGRDLSQLLSGTQEQIAQNLMNSGILDADRAWKLAGQLADDAYETTKDMSELELKRVEDVNNWMSEGQATLDSIIAGTFGAITKAQQDWLKNLNEVELETAKLLVGIWSQNTKSGATTGESGADALDLIMDYIGGVKGGEKALEVGGDTSSYDYDDGT